MKLVSMAASRNDNGPLQSLRHVLQFCFPVLVNTNFSAWIATASDQDPQ